MKVVSIDFGTTNCAVSFCENKKDIEIVKAYQGREIIPSIVAYNIMDGEISIGNRDLKGNGEFKVFEAFKMLLSGNEDPGLLKKYGYDEVYTPQKVAKDFINELMKLVNGLIGDIGELFVTIPHIWEKNTNLQSKEVLKRLFEESGHPVKKFIPEPVAAASYFCHKYQLNSKSQFKGHLLVIDWGGGTLDISLCEANEKEIKVLETTGFGVIGSNEIGKGGFTYDRLTCMKLLKENNVAFDAEEIDKDPNFLKLLNEFERTKISSNEGINKSFKNYIRDKVANKPISFFSLTYNGTSIPVRPSDLVEPSEEFMESLEIELRKIDKTINENGINPKNINAFKIIPAGGFGAYYLVENAITTYYKSAGSDDGRFPTPNEINMNERGLAISKGACAIGAGLIDLVPMVMWTFGIKFYEFTNSGLVERPIKIFEKGKKYSDFKQKKYVVNGDIWYPTSAKNAAFKLYVELNGEQLDTPVYKNSEFFPNSSVELIKYKMAYQIIDDDFFIFIEYTNIKEKERQVSLSKLMDLFRSGHSIISTN